MPRLTMPFTREPEAKGLHLGSPEASNAQQVILQTKPILQDFYMGTYKRMIAAGNAHLTATQGIDLELGSGGGFFRAILPTIVTSDIKPVDGIDRVIDGQSLPFDDESIRAIYAMHVIHHIPDIERFLSELRRVVPRGGGLVAVEPYWSPLARLCYSRLHPEPWDPGAATWTFESSGPLSSNQALTYILLKRDRELFRRRWSDFDVIPVARFGGPSYLMSGGIWRTPLLPQTILSRLARMEDRTHWWHRSMALHHLFVLRRRS